jgi:TolA-binding protein
MKRTIITVGGNGMPSIPSNLEKLQAAKTEAKTAFVSKIGSLLGSGKLKEVEQHNRKLCELVTDREQYIDELHEKIQRTEDSHSKQLDEMQRKHQSEVLRFFNRSESSLRLSNTSSTTISSLPAQSELN